MQDTGGPTTTDPAAGVSSFFAGTHGQPVKDAAFPHGLYIDNAAPTATTNAAKGHITILDQTYVGEDQAGDLTVPAIPAPHRRPGLPVLRVSRIPPST